MFHHFVRRSETDIMFIQEVTSMEVLQIPGYIVHCNLGTEIRGTAILAREGITLDDNVRAPSGRAIAAVYQGILLLNVYAPSGTSRRPKEKNFIT
jgi:exonuclease III